MKSSSPYETAGLAGALDAAWLQARQGRRQSFLVGEPGFGTPLGCSETYGDFGILARKICKDLGVEMPG